MKRILKGAALFLALFLMLTGCKSKPEGARVLLDGKAYDGAPVSETSTDELRVYITLDGEPVIDLPFGEAHTVEIAQADGSVNAVLLTGDKVVMESSNCDNQDCVEMGEVTRDNCELRVMGGFIICLPHKVSVEVRGK